MVFLLALLASCVEVEPTTVSSSPALFCDEVEGGVLSLRGGAVDPVATDAMTRAPALVFPDLRFERVGGVAEGEAAEARSVPLSGEDPRVTWTGPGAMDVAVDADLGLSPGQWDVVLVRPDGSEVRASPAFVVAGPPSLSGTDPAGFCAGGSHELRLLGSGFLVLDGLYPSVTVNGEDTPVSAAEDCTPLAAPAEGEVCATLVLSADATGLALGEVPLAVTNPTPAACASSEPATVEVRAVPEISAVTPEAVCRTGAEIEIQGAFFTSDMDVEVGGLPATDVTFVDDGTLLAVIPEQDALGTVDVAVVGGGGCDATLADAVRVAAEPLVFHVDPPAVYSGATTEVDAYVSDLIGEVTEAWIERADTGETVAVDWSWDAERPGVVHVVVPAGLADGSYTVAVTQDETCPGSSSGSFDVTSSLRVSVESVDPAFAWIWTWTPVQILAADPLPSGFVGFQEGASVFLIGEDGASEALLSVDVDSELAISAIVPDELDPGFYDVLVVNPDGGVGLLQDGIELTEQAPPTIRTVTPASLPHTGTQSFTIQGKEFRDPTVSLTCLDTGVESTLRATVDDWDYSSIEASVSAGGYNQAVCVVEVVNADGASARWSAMSITNPSDNLFPWTDGQDLVVPRRAPTAAAGRTTSITRYLYALGGDSGNKASPYDSIEIASVGVYGEMGAWSTLGTTLPEPRTLAVSTTIGRFVYLIGGYDGSTAVNTTWRAVILDPLDVPRFEDLSVETGVGLAGGRWTWRVSALFPDDDTVNPGGESLPSDPITVTLPEVDGGAAPTLTWEAVEGASGYRVYRTAEVDADPDEVGWVADVSDGSLSYTDLGDATDPALIPLEDGALGAWAELDALHVERESPCLATGPDPRTDPVIQYIYVAGGKNAAGNRLDSIERLDVTVVSDDLQTAGAWELLDTELSKSRYRCGGFTADSSLHPTVPEGETWVYFAGGADTTNATGVVDAGRVAEGGDLEDWDTVKTMSPARAGFAQASASGYLYAFGGSQGEASASGVSSEIDGSSLPDLDNWNSLGISMSSERLLPGFAQESAVIFVVGGEDENGDALSTCETTNF